MTGSTTDARVKFATRRLVSTLTRPANADQYAAGDVVSATDDGHLTFSGALETPHTGMISGARVICNANQATKPDLELWLFRSDIGEVADNAAFAPTDAEMETLVGVIAFPTANFLIGNPGSGADGNSVCEAFPLAIPLRLAGTPDAKTIYGQLVVRNTYTPVSAEQFTVELYTTLD